MITKARFLFFAAVLVTAGLVLGLVLSSSFDIQTRGYGQEYKVPDEAVELLSRIGSAMAALADAVKPSVVNISTSRTVRAPELNPFMDDPFFRRFFGDRFRDVPRERKAMSLGSGVIVDPNGYILTNNHVIQGAEEIKVTLMDQKEYTGKVIGTDPKTDLAVIRIEARDLPAIKWGDSDKLRVGETVVAVGNPYGLNQTVTQGIVSAVGRANVDIADYEDFIQTDAAINPGNSGGGLVNVRGELVGVNTAIFSTSGGYQGIGFAIPSNMARSVMKSLIEKGKVIRGWLGIWIQPLTPELASQFGIKDENGALVSDVVEGGPADKAGLQAGDFVTSFAGKDVKNPTDLRTIVANTAPGTDVRVEFIRNGKKETATLHITEQPEEEAVARAEADNALGGVHVQEITPALRKSENIPPRVKGVYVANVNPDSPAAGIVQKGDVIMEINRERVAAIEEYVRAVRKVAPDQNVLVLLYRNGQVFYTTVPAR